MASAAVDRLIPTPPLSDDEKSPVVSPCSIPAVPSKSRSTSRSQYERKMGDTELSYYLPSRQTGVNDMYVCLLTVLKCFPKRPYVL